MSVPGSSIVGMTNPLSSDPKAVLHRYLNRSREALMWKVQGLSDHDVRRPLTRTGTNMLGLVKHLASVEAGYFGGCFGRPLPDPPAWFAELDEADPEPNLDMWATPDESTADILGLYRRACAHADETIAALDLDAVGQVPWWGPQAGPATLHRMLVHMIDETARHCGHADIVRELIDGAAGVRPGGSNLPSEDPAWWAAYRAKVQAAADHFAP
jgi:uncharacterized damage-inducible protein DinB